MSGQRQYILLSVLDRLNSGADEGVLGGHAADLSAVKSSVLRDVENLLNNRRNIVDPPESCTHLNASLFVYGIEDFVAQNPKSPHIRHTLKKSIETTIDKFEPRLRRVSVEFNDEEGNEQNLCFTVMATLYADPVQEPIYFDTWFSVNRGEYKIKNVK